MSVPADWDPARRLVTYGEAAASAHRPQSTIRRWVHEGRLSTFGYLGRHPLVLEMDVLAVDAATRHRKPPNTPVVCSPQAVPMSTGQDHPT